MSGMYHIGLGPEHLVGNDGVGRYVFLPGDRSRAERIADHFEDRQHIVNSRGHDSHLGIVRASDGTSVEVLAISSGMGPASVEIIATELLDCGAKRLVRVGSSAGVHPAVEPGSVVILTGAVRDESTSDRWTPREYPAISDPQAVAAMMQGAQDAGLASRCFTGIGHSKNSLFGREFARGPLTQENEQYLAALAASGVLATEMEASLLFVLASVASAQSVQPISAGALSASVQAACVLAVYGEAGSEVSRQADRDAISVACAGVLAWACQDAQR